MRIDVRSFTVMNYVITRIAKQYKLITFSTFLKSL